MSKSSVTTPTDDTAQAPALPTTPVNFSCVGTLSAPDGVSKLSPSNKQAYPITAQVSDSQKSTAIYQNSEYVVNFFSDNGQVGLTLTNLPVAGKSFNPTARVLTSINAPSFELKEFGATVATDVVCTQTAPPLTADVASSPVAFICKGDLYGIAPNSDSTLNDKEIQAVVSPSDQAQKTPLFSDESYDVYLLSDGGKLTLYAETTANQTAFAYASGPIDAGFIYLGGTAADSSTTGLTCQKKAN